MSSDKVLDVSNGGAFIHFNQVTDKLKIITKATNVMNT